MLRVEQRGESQVRAVREPPALLAEPHVPRRIAHISHDNPPLEPGSVTQPVEGAMMCAMDLRRELEYDSAPADVFAMLCDEAFRSKVCEATLAIEYDVAITSREQGADVRIRRVMPANVPDMARRFVGDTLEIVQTEEWGAASADGTRTARLRMEMPGKPGNVTGTITLGPHGQGSREVIDAVVKVSVPLVGGKLEEQVVRGIKAGIREEGKVGQAWLAGDR
ncbi:MAG: DUF2505 family protein [Propionibacteriales bacterium]|nr:DUF2505 family protein [Propionibacteriales bacterium]